MTPMMELFTAMWNYSNDEPQDRQVNDLMQIYLDLEYKALKNAWMAERKVTEKTDEQFEQWFNETYER